MKKDVDKNQLNVKVEAEFQEYNWDNLKTFIQHLTQNPLGVCFRIKISDVFEV